MGGTTFETIGEGATAEDAFKTAREQQAWEHGHGGYTGTLAEKPWFQQFDLKTPDPTAARDALHAMGWEPDVETLRGLLLRPQEAERAIAVYDEKWGEAVCIPMGDGRFLFGGWASC